MRRLVTRRLVLATIAAAASAATPGAVFAALVPGDAWRGTMTNCQQHRLQKQRRYRYLPVELTIDEVLTSGEVVATFTLHLDHSSYQLRGAYDEKTRRLYLRADAAADPAKPGWKPCDAEAYLSADFSTLTGMPICADADETGHPVGCDPGGGEFTMRHDRTRFVVEGAGDARVNGLYRSNGSRAWTSSDSVMGVEAYDGAPVYVQTCPDRTVACAPFALVHEVVGQFGFWRIVPAETLRHKHVGRDPAVYAACSEAPYPPTNGWRPLGSRPRGLRGGDFAAVASAPAPTVRSVVSSMYSHLDVHEQLRAGAPAFQPSQTYGYLLILMIGALLWALVLLVSGVRLKSGA